jgi:nitrogen regulatory protein P-II 2
MAIHHMTLLTIVTETLARPALSRLLSRHGQSSFTVTTVEGAGDSGGQRTGDMDALSNVKLEMITTRERADTLLGELERDYFPNFAMIAYTSDVGVVRQAKFSDPRP